MWADRFGWALWRDSAPVAYSVSLNEGGGGAESQAAIFFACLYIVRVIFNWVSKVIRDCIGFALLCSVIGLENSRHLLSQSDTKLKPIATWLLAFSRA